jgi:hypothetical protein
VDLDKQNAVDSFFALQLLHFHRIRNQALGVKHDTHFTGGLLWFAYQGQQREYKQAINLLGEAAYLKGIIGTCRSEIKRMIDEAKTPEERRKVLPQVQQLSDQAERAGIRLEALE